jgi:hypothetical protein
MKVQLANGMVPAGHPEVIYIHGWEDGLPKHVARYAKGFRVLFPSSRKILVLSPISKTMFSSLQQHTDSIAPVVGALQMSQLADIGDDQVSPTKVLIHAMFNTGAVNYTATLNTYRQLSSFHSSTPAACYGFDTRA